MGCKKMILETNPHNPRTISKAAYEKLKASIERNPDGLTANKIAYKDGIIISGNQRYRALTELGLEHKKEWFKDLSGWTPEQIDEWIIQSNISAGEWDWDILANEWEADTLIDWGIDMPDDWGSTKELPEDIDDIPEVKTPVSKLGDLWLLGNHRVLCGDSTDKTTVERLMDGKKADMVFTDPPYGVDIKGKFTGKIKNDNLVGDELQEFLKKAFAILKVTSKGSFYICYEVLNQKEFNDAFGSKPDEIIVWVKDSASFYSDNKYNRRFEAIAYYENDNKLKTKAETNVWEFAKSSSFNSRDENGLRFNEPGNYLVAHPTTKPVGLVSRAINNSSIVGQIILDVFLGSGSTLIACEQTNRQCYGLELDPHYVDVICKRWQTLTGQMPILESTGETHDFSS